MRGKYKVFIQNKRIRYEFEVKRNLTILRGDSATGKTALIDMVREYFENGTASGIDLQCERECVVLEGRNWALQLQTYHESIVFIDEGNPFLTSSAFAATIQKTDNYYVIATRESLPALPYSVDEIYGIRNSGKYGTIKRTYNELFHLYGKQSFNETVKPDMVLTEDSNAGYQYFNAICEENQISCETACGKSNVLLQFMA